MNAVDLAFWMRASRRVAGLQPEMQRALLRSYAIIRASFSESEVAQLVATGQLDLLVARVFSDVVLDRAFLPFRQRLRITAERSFKFVANDLPKAGKIDGELAVMFDTLSPDVVTAIQTLETGVLGSLKEDVRATVREAVRQGLIDGVAPRAVARGIPGVIGLGESQLDQIANYESVLRGVPGRSVTNYTLRNPIVDRLLSKGPLTESQIARYTDAYRKARLTANTETVTRTATLNAYKAGQDLSWRNAVDAGIVDGDRLMKMWIQIQRKSKREEHIPLNGETVPFFQPYSNGSMVPGDKGEPNCGCLSRVFLASA